MEIPKFKILEIWVSILPRAIGCSAWLQQRWRQDWFTVLLEPTPENWNAPKVGKEVVAELPFFLVCCVLPFFSVIGPTSQRHQDPTPAGKPTHFRERKGISVFWEDKLQLNSPASLDYWSVTVPNDSKCITAHLVSIVVGKGTAAA